MRPAKILVTLDSSDKVLGVLRGNNMLDSCLFVVDEFQCLMGDATFKGSTDMNFLIRLDSEVKRICYLSATPVPDIYLDYIPQFANIPYYKLEWDPDVIVEPTLKERQMRNGETAEKLCGELIQRYRRDGYFERKIVDGNIVCSREACIFLNEVKSIIRIIGQNSLKPDEVTILCITDIPKLFITLFLLSVIRNMRGCSPFDNTLLLKQITETLILIALKVVQRFTLWFTLTLILSHFYC